MMNLNQKNQTYFTNVRTDIFPILDAPYGRAIEIGCGMGSTLLHLKTSGMVKWVGGVEPFADLGSVQGLDRIWQDPVEQLLAQKALPETDLLLCLDVLEHLVDPWTVLRQLVELLPSGGSLVISLPNIRHYKVVLPLLMHGQFKYSDQGILDYTHLRFFTRDSALELVKQAGVDVVSINGNSRLKPFKNKWLLNKLSGNRLSDIYHVQYLIKAVKP